MKESIVVLYMRRATNENINHDDKAIQTHQNYRNYNIFIMSSLRMWSNENLYTARVFVMIVGFYDTTNLGQNFDSNFTCRHTHWQNKSINTSKCKCTCAYTHNFFSYSVENSYKTVR